MPLLGNLLDPIPGDSPCGENLYYSPAYDKIKEARREEQDAPQGEWRHDVKKADFVQVIKLTTDLLAKKSKDLQLAAWLTEALLREEGIGSFADGLDLLRGFVENFWEGLYPELEDGDAEMRATPLNWVGARMGDGVRQVALTRSGLNWLRYRESRSVPSEDEAAASEVKSATRETAISEGKLTPEEFDGAVAATPTEYLTDLRAGLARTLESVESLGQVCDEKFGDVSPSFGPLRQAIEEVQTSVRILLANRGATAAPQSEQAEATPVEEASWGEAEVERPALRASAAPAARTATAEPADQEDAFRRVASAAAFLRKESPCSPVSYLLLRGLRWGELRAGGASLDESLLESPPTEIRQKLKKSAAEGQWEEVLDTAEVAMALPCGRGWLDLQRCVVRACENLGSWYDPIAASVRAGVKALVTDYPGLRSAAMTDDTPTANPETLAWLDELAAAPSAETQSYAAPAPVASSPEQAAQPADAYDLAMEAMRARRPQEAIEILSQEIAQVRSGRLRFQRKVQLSQICMASGYEAIALPILEEIAKEIEQRTLEDWEVPDMLAHPLVLLFRCLNKLERDPEVRQRIYARICRLDPLQALSCSK
jgi:type VI secretion system protein ImpA